MAFYDNLLSVCQDNGITVTELLRELNMSSGNLSKWKNNGAPRSASLKKIADRLNVSADRLLGTTPAYLMGETDDPNGEDCAENDVLGTMTAEEIEMIRIFRAMSDEKKKKWRMMGDIL